MFIKYALRIPFIFTGVGKGFVGVVARPASGLIDLASCSFEEIKRYIIRTRFVSFLLHDRCYTHE